MARADLFFENLMDVAKTQDSSTGGSPADFFRESVAELKKVHVPSRAETIQATVVTLFIMAFVSILLFVFDFVFRRLIQSLLA